MIVWVWELGELGFCFVVVVVFSVSQVSKLIWRS